MTQPAAGISLGPKHAAVRPESDWSAASALKRLFRQALVPFRSFASRRNTWEELQAELTRLTPAAIDRLPPAAAGNVAARLKGRYWWHLRHGEKESERVELRALIAAVALRAGLTDEAIAEHDLAARQYETVRERIPVQQRLAIAKRLALLRAGLAAAERGRGKPEEAATLAYAALRLHVLPPEQQTGLIATVVQARPESAETWSACLDFLHACGEARAHLISPSLMTWMQKRTETGSADLPRARQQATSLLRRIALAAPWLEWPLLRLAEHDLEAAALEPARAKLDLLSCSPKASPRVPFLLGQVAYFQERYEEADRYFATALDAGIDAAGVYEFRGIAKANIGAFDAAQGLIEQALEAAPKDDYLRLQLANILLCRGDLDGAESAHRALLARRGDDADVLFGLGKVQDIRGNAGEARALYDRAVAVNAQHVPALFSLALAVSRDGDAAAARQRLARIHALDATHLPTRAELGIALVQDGLVGDAFALAEAMGHLTACERASYPDDRVAYWLGRAFAAREDYDECLRRWEPLLTRHHTPALRRQIDTVVFLSALWHAELGAAEEALELLGRASAAASDELPIEPLRDHVELLVARQALRKGHVTQAEPPVARVLQRRPAQARALLLHGIIGLRKGQLARDEMMGIVARLEESTERELLRLIGCLFERQRVAGDVAIWDRVDRERLPERVACDPLLSFFDLVDEAIRSQREGVTMDEGRVVALLERAAEGHGSSTFGNEDLALFFAHLIRAAGSPPRLLEQLHELAELSDESCLRLAESLLRVAANDFDGVAALADRVTNGALTAYATDVLCHCAYKELARAAREPVRLRRAADLIRRAAETE